MSKKKQPDSGGIENIEEALTRTEQYIEDNQKSLMIIVGAIVLVVGGYLSYQRFYLKPQEAEAQSQMYVAEQYFEQDSFNLALEGDGNYPGFLEIIDDYNFTESANLSNYYAGISYLKLGDYENAIDYLKQFDGDDKVVATIALGSIGDAYVELGDIEKAITYYKKAANRNDNDLVSPIYFKKAGLAHEELNEYDKAINAYKKIKKNFPNSDEGREIDKYIAAAEAKKLNQ